MVNQIILAAGLSSRMGTPKPLLDFDGQPLLALLLDQCRRSRLDSVLVVLGHRWKEIVETVDLSGAQVVIHHGYRMGQTSSLQAGVRALPPETRCFLNLPVDHPFVTHREIDALIYDFGKQPDPDAILVPTFKGRDGRPALFGAGLRDTIHQLATNLPVRSLIHRYGEQVRRVAVDNPYIMTDMDTPQDYWECLRTHRRLRSERAHGLP